MVSKAYSNHPQHSTKSIFWTKSSYHHFAQIFHRYHKHDLNALAHVLTTGLGVWGAIQMTMVVLNPQQGIIAVYAYACLIASTTPVVTAFFHTGFVCTCLQYPVFDLVESIQLPVDMIPGGIIGVCALAIAAGYGLQDLCHWLCAENTLMSSYIQTHPSTLVIHTIWLMPLVIDTILTRHFFIPKLFVNRNRNISCQVASKKAVEDLRAWIRKEVPEKSETIHVWPHQQEATSGPIVQLENDASIIAALRTVFASHHFDIRSVVEMNEIYVTAIGSIKEITSDAVFYTPHTDGPFWWLPGASLYRILVGVTPNRMVRTNFNLQHVSQNKTVDMYDTLGFDYNRELHWIDHVAGQSNTERRSLIKLHFIVYPKGWHNYGKLCGFLNTTYNTWARKNFLRTLRPVTTLDQFNAWWIFATTWTNAMFELHVGWPNIVYVTIAYALDEIPFVVLTSFRHYCIYIATFAYRSPPVAHGFMMRDCKLYKSLAILNLSKRLLPLVKLPSDLIGIAMATMGFSITILATMQLGMVRTYFGSELGFVKPSWISKFPYNAIPHPMIVGQLIGFSSILYWWKDQMQLETMILVGAHMCFYALHMIQEILTSSY